MQPLFVVKRFLCAVPRNIVWFKQLGMHLLNNKSYKWRFKKSPRLLWKGVLLRHFLDCACVLSVAFFALAAVWKSRLFNGSGVALKGCHAIKAEKGLERRRSACRNNQRTDRRGDWMSSSRPRVTKCVFYIKNPRGKRAWLNLTASSECFPFVFTMCFLILYAMLFRCVGL